MPDHPFSPDERILPVLQRYSQGRISAYDAACEIQDLNLPGYDDPSAGDVIQWANLVGFGIPTPSKEEARSEAEEILRKQSSHE